MPTRIPITPIGGIPIKLHITALDDADETTIVTVVHSADNPSWSESFAHTRAGAIRSLGRDALLGKVDSGGGRRFRDGRFRLYVSEADQVVNAPGASSDICYYDSDVPLFPPQAASGAADVAALVARITALEAVNAVQQATINRHEQRLDAISTGAAG